MLPLPLPSSLLKESLQLESLDRHMADMRHCARRMTSTRPCRMHAAVMEVPSPVMTHYTIHLQHKISMAMIWRSQMLHCRTYEVQPG